MTEYQIWSLVGSIGAVVVAFLSLAHSMYVNAQRQKDEKKLGELEGALAKYQAELIAADVDPELDLVGIGESNQGRAHLAVRMRGKEVTNLRVESDDGYDSRVAKTTFRGNDEICAIIFEGADREYVRKASFTLGFTSAIGMQRALHCRVDRGKLTTTPVHDFGE